MQLGHPKVVMWYSDLEAATHIAMFPVDYKDKDTHTRVQNPELCIEDTIMA